MDPLFECEPGRLPEWREPTGTWTVTAADFGKLPPPQVRHAVGYDAFDDLAVDYGTDPRALLDLWTFAHFVRAHREAFDADAALLHSAVVFLGNVCIQNYPECCWSAKGRRAVADWSPGASTSTPANPSSEHD